VAGRANDERRSRADDERRRRARRLSAGRAPALTTRGRAWAAGGALLVAGSVLFASYRVAALGVVSLTALGALYVAFFPTSVMIWRRHLELSWRLARGARGGELSVGRPFSISVLLRNRSPRALGYANLVPITSTALGPPAAIPLALPAAAEASAIVAVEAKRVGMWFLHGAAVEVRDRLGLFSVEAYFPSPFAVRILPRASLRLLPASRRLSAGAPHERLGDRPLRAAGPSGELRELREHAPGDPWKLIAWKASARTGKLMVRELNRETMMTHWLLVDVGGTMRDGEPGHAPLDLAVDVAAAFARGALEAGDRVALITFDGRIVGALKPGDGPVHRLHIVERLMEAMTLVDEDLTELGDSELAATVARYLVQQEGIDALVRQPPPIDDPVWSELVAASTGELYDLRVIKSAVDAALERRRAVNLDEPNPLRRHCRAFGIELPYRRSYKAGVRARGLALALERAAAARGSQRIVVLSDLLGLDGDLAEVARALRLVRRRGHHLTVAAPRRQWTVGQSFAAEEEIRAWHAERRQRAAQKRLAALGVRAQALSADNLLALLRTPSSTRVSSSALS
jgi:uncharacterized protein (DUF58 family)